MKKIALLLSACLLLVIWVSAANTDDPLVSLSYLTGTFTDTIEDTVEDLLNDSDEEILDGVSSGEATLGSSAAYWTETRLKSGDTLIGSTGTNLLVLAGSMNVLYETGAVVDVSAGSVVPNGSALLPDHRYLVAEDTTALFTVTGKTAVLQYQGPYSLSLSDAIDYNAMASALKELNLFRGSFTGYGQGYDLEVSPTRLQALIMFIRVLGEEEEALAWSGALPFKDIEPNSQAAQYVGYAYSMGYTTGYTTTEFKPSLPVNARQYTEFILRAMGYSSVANTNLSDTLERAQGAGVITSGEVTMLQSGTFLRADLVYLSYYSLESLLPDLEQTLADSLMDKDVFTSSAYRNARKLVSSRRL